jgi:hypothetical protein
LAPNLPKQTKFHTPKLANQIKAFSKLRNEDRIIEKKLFVFLHEFIFISLE